MKRIASKLALCLALTMALTACGKNDNKTNNKTDSKTDNKKCPENTGWSGDNCDQCTGDFWGKNCDQKPTCQNGTPSLGVNGNGKCTGACNEHFAGENCDDCADSYFGDTCQNKCACSDKQTCKSGKSGSGCECTDERLTGDNCDQCKFADATAGSLVDSNSNITYKTTWINCHEWMAENMQNTVANDGSSLTCHIQKVFDKTCDNGEEGGSEIDCYKDVPDFKKDYGCLYSLADAQKVCPAGWHLPTQSDVKAMIIYTKEHKKSATLFQALIAKSGWKAQVNSQSELDDTLTDIIGGDDFGFNALPAGMAEFACEDGECVYDDFADFGLAVYFWTSTVLHQEEGDEAYRFGIDSIDSEHVDVLNLTSYMGIISVRCLKD